MGVCNLFSNGSEEESSLYSTWNFSEKFEIVLKKEKDYLQYSFIVPKTSI